MIATSLKTVLVADDQPQIVEVVRLSLVRAGCRVEVAASGQAALRRADAERIDLLIIDVGMPGMDGFETLRQLMRKPGYAALPVIILTGSGDAKIRAAAEQLGVAAFLTKPFSPTELQRLVQKLLGL